jgi:peptidoglycan/xylan/chitin deacetylase (PgdA/CDA1 family)
VRRLILSLALISPLTILVWPAGGVAFMLLTHLLLVWASLNPSCQWLGRVVTSFEPEGNQVWLTIDDGPHGEDTPRILDLLDRYDARATFFVKGTALRSNTAVGSLIIARGSEMANHSDTHPSGSFWRLLPKAIRREIVDCDQSIREIDPQRRPLFRAPVGMKNPFVHPVLSELGLDLIGWSSRGFEGVSSGSASRVVARLLRNVRPGAIILLHEGRRSGDGSAPNVIILERLLEELQRRNFRCVIPPRASFLPPLER